MTGDGGVSRDGDGAVATGGAAAVVATVSARADSNAEMFHTCGK